MSSTVACLQLFCKACVLLVSVVFRCLLLLVLPSLGCCLVCCCACLLFQHCVHVLVSRVVSMYLSLCVSCLARKAIVCPTSSPVGLKRTCACKCGLEDPGDLGVDSKEEKVVNVLHQEEISK